MSEPSKDDLADTLSAAYKNMRENSSAINEFRETLSYYTGYIIILGNLIVACLAFLLVFTITSKVLSAKT